MPPLIKSILSKMLYKKVEKVLKEIAKRVSEWAGRI
jgi:hypothetical protein